MTTLPIDFQERANLNVGRWTPGDDDGLHNVGGLKTDKEEVDDEDDSMAKVCMGKEGAHRSTIRSVRPLASICLHGTIPTSLVTRQTRQPKIVPLKKKPHESREKLRVKCS